MKDNLPIRERYARFHTEIRSNGTLRVASINEEATMAHDEFREQSDINYIMKRYSETGEINFVNKMALNQGSEIFDTTQLPDYKQSLEIVIQANDAFMSLPADARKKFDNDPGKLIEFLKDEKNHEEALKLGLMELKDVSNEQKILHELKTQNSNLEKLHETNKKLGMTKNKNKPESES